MVVFVLSEGVKLGMERKHLEKEVKTIVDH